MLLLKRFSPYLFFSALVFIFMPDVFLKGKVFIAKMGDPHLATYSLAVYFRDVVKNGIFPLWNPLSFCGYPYDADAVSNVNLLNLLVLAVNDINMAWNIMMSLNIFCAALFSYLYVQTLGFSRLACFVSGIIFSLAPSSGCYIDSWGFFLPLILWLFEKYLAARKISYLVLCFFSFSALFLTAVPQYSLYIGAFFACYTLWRSRSLIGIAILVFSFGAVSFHAFRLFEALRLSPRSSLWMVNVLLPIHLINMVFPFLFESPFRPDTNFFFSKLFSEATRILFHTDKISYMFPPYVGILGFTLFLFSWKGKGLVTFYRNVAIVLFLYMMTFPIFFPIYQHIPVLAQLPRLSRLGVILTFVLAVLAGAGADRLLKEKIRLLPMALFFVTLLGAVILGFVVIRGVISFNGPALRVLIVEYVQDHVIGKAHYQAPPEFYLDRVDQFFSFLKEWSYLGSPSVLIPAVFIIASLSLVFLWQRALISKSIFTAGCIFVVTLDLLLFVRIMEYRMSTPGELKPKSDAIDFLQGDKDIFRIMPILTPAKFGKGRTRGLLAPNSNLLYDLGSVEGWNPFLPESYASFFKTFQPQPDPDPAIILGGAEGDFDYKVTRFLNVKYFITKKDQNLKADLPVAFEDRDYKIYLNNDYLPRAILVYDYRVIPNDTEALTYLKRSAVDFSESVVLKEEPQLHLTRSEEIRPAKGSVVIQKYEPNLVEMNVSTPENGLLVFTDNYYPGWKAMIDGKASKILKANISFKAVEVPEGKHMVEFVYEPDSLRLGTYASIGTILLGLTWLALLRRRTGTHLQKVNAA